VTTGEETRNATDARPCKSCGAEIAPKADRCECGAFAPGNSVSLLAGREGALAHEFVAGVEQSKVEIEEWIGDGPGSEDRFAGARLSAAVALTRLRLAGRLLDTIGMFDGRGRPRPAAATLETANAAFLMHLEKLGLTPTGAIKLREKHAPTADDFLSRAAEVAAKKRRARAVDQDPKYGDAPR
jgi:hypothetical protein